MTRDELARRRLTVFEVLRPLRLVLLHGNGLAQLGCTAQITSSDLLYDEPQRLARELWLHPDAVDGISYLCRHDNDLRACALYDRAADARQILDAEDVLADHARLLAWSRRYGFALA